MLKRGDIRKPGEKVEPGTLASCRSCRANSTLPREHAEGDRRAALAKWLTDANNPLTWRVMANRVWQWHFGAGLVGTPNDFGRWGRSRRTRNCSTGSRANSKSQPQPSLEGGE